MWSAWGSASRTLQWPRLPELTRLPRAQSYLPSTGVTGFHRSAHWPSSTQQVAVGSLITTACVHRTDSLFTEFARYSPTFCNKPRTAVQANTNHSSNQSRHAVCMQVPGGWAAQRWGGRRMLLVSFGLWSTASVLTPGSASSNSAIMLARVAVGVAQGFLIPSVHTVLSQVTCFI